MSLKVCVIGAGTMGSGIAAHLANLGFQVTLLDMDVDNARAALDRARSLRPPHFYDPKLADHIRIGGIKSDIGWVSEMDWVCEAISEKIEWKQALYAEIEPFLREDTLISTNTSGLEIQLLAEGRSDSFRRRFIGTHFFNPPRYLKLLELIPTQETDPAVIEKYTQMLEEHVGRRVVLAKDTPGFIANRYGMWCMFHATHVAEQLRLSPEQVDAITGPFLGRPRTGSFRLNDLVGLDIMLDIASNLYARCPEDPHRDVLKTPASIAHLFEKGHLGTKSGMGFYRKEGKELLTFDLTTQAYRQMQEPDLPSLKALGKLPLGERIREALMLKDEVGEFMRLYLVPALRYAEYLKEEISHNVEEFDRVMMWGFGWEMGPFGMMDAIGMTNAVPHYVGNEMRSFSGEMITRKNEPEYRQLSDYPVLETHPGFLVRDLGDGVKSLSTTTKMGTYNPENCRALTEWLESNDAPIVVTSEAKHFSLGFDLNVFRAACEASDWEAVDNGLLALQGLALALRKKRSVAAVFGYCLGGGFEVALGCQKVIAHPEAMIGLPEIKVGLFPGGAGTIEMRRRHSATVKEVAHIAKSLFTGAVSTCAQQAFTLGYLRPGFDVIAKHPDRLLHDAKLIAMHTTVENPPKWNDPEGPLVGMVDQVIAELAKTPDWASYDENIAEEIKWVLTKSKSYEDGLKKEREHFVKLCQNGMTQERIKHMLESNKPLRN